MAVILVAVGLAWWRFGDGTGARAARAHGGPDSSAAPGARGATNADPRIAGAGASPHADHAEVEEHSSEAADAGGPSRALEQVAAAFALGAQADVSAYLERNAELAAEHVDRFCKDSRAASKPWPKAPREGRDAAPWMASRVDWTTEPTRMGTLHLDDRLIERVEATSSGWAEALGVGDLAGLDFSWLRELEAYDMWSLASAGPLAEEPSYELADAPLPSYVQLMAWVKLRFIRALALGDGADASREVRHLSALLHRQGALIPEVVSVKLLELERVAFAVAVARGQDVGGWSPPPDADHAALIKLIKAGPNFFMPGVAPEVMSKAAACATAPCSALLEAGAIHAAIGSESPVDTSRGLRTLTDSYGCDPALMAALERLSPTTPGKARATLLGGPSFLEALYPGPSLQAASR